MQGCQLSNLDSKNIQSRPEALIEHLFLKVKNRCNSVPSCPFLHLLASETFWCMSLLKQVIGLKCAKLECVLYFLIQKLTLSRPFRQSLGLNSFLSRLHLF